MAYAQLNKAMEQFTMETWIADGGKGKGSTHSKTGHECLASGWITKSQQVKYFIKTGESTRVRSKVARNMDRANKLTPMEPN